MKAKTCINCGAPLHSNICDYCGTEYEIDDNCNHTQKGKRINDFIYELDIQGKPYRFYVGEVEVNKLTDVGRDKNGNVIPIHLGAKRKLTLIEI